MPNYKLSLHSKLPQVGTTIFTVMSELAVKHNAVNLAQGFPDFPVSPKLIELTEKYMRKGFNQYTHMAGALPLREAIAGKTETLYGTRFSHEKEITVTAGATQALYTAITALITEGDEVIIFTPAYDSYQPAIELSGGKCIFVQLTQPDYSIDWEQVKKVLNRKTRMIVINSPHNPSGAVLSEHDLEQLQRITADSGIIILSDEVYEHMVFDGKKHLSMASNPKLAERSVIVSSFGKTYHCTGWKVGYVIAPEEITREIRKVHQYLVFSVNTPVQLALAEFMEDQTQYTGLSTFYQEKRDYFLSLLEGSSFSFIKSAGTYFQLLNYGEIAQKKDLEFAKYLVQEHKLAAIPTSVFYQKEPDLSVLRFCFAKDNETLEKAAQILKSLTPVLS
ncbi:MAG: methionine aminotransferase [Luteibaculaceae bacterium]